MTTFQEAATAYLKNITATHTPSTMRTYQRNFDVVLTPYFGADTLVERITGDRVQEFLTSPEFLKKPNGQPRAEPTKDQISGLLRAFLVHAGVTDLPVIPRTRRAVERLCAKCRGPLDTPAAPPEPPAPEAPQPPVATTSAAEAIPEAVPEPPAKKKTTSRTAPSVGKQKQRSRK
jgi:hypothetical protein